MRTLSFSSAGYFLFALTLVGLAAAKPPRHAPGAMRAAEKSLVNIDEHGLALKGHDPVAYFSDGKAVAGSADFTAKHNGATYRFASRENLERFVRSPQRFLPAYGGFCGYGVAKGQLAPSDPNAFQIVNGRLIMQYDQGAVKMFSKDLEANLAKAETNWPRLVREHGR